MQLTFTPRKAMAEYEWDFQKKAWNRPPLDVERLKELSRPDNARSFARLALFLGLLAATAAAAVHAQKFSFWHALPFLYAYWFVFGFWGALAHELQHKIVFTKSLDRFSEVLFFIAQTAIWLSPTCSRATHRIHHRYTMVKSIDHETREHEHLTPRSVRRFLGSFILRMLVVGAIPAMIKDGRLLVRRAAGRRDQILDDHCTAEEVRRIRLESAAILLIHAAAVLAAVWFRNWNPVLLLVLGWPIGGGFENLWHQTQHAGRSYDVNDQRLATRSVQVGPLVKWLYWGLDDHIEHHLFPAVPSANLPRLHALLKEYIPPRRGLIGCWQEIFAIARERAVRPDSEYVTLRDRTF